MKLLRLEKVLGLVLCALVHVSMTRAADDADDKKETGGNVLTVVDAKGKEQKLTSWKFVQGTQRLTWLAPKTEPKDPEKKDDEPKSTAPLGPEALVFRDENSTGFVKGVQTLIPLSSLRSLEYDYENKKATVRIAAGATKDDDVVLTGSAAEFVGINQVTIAAEVDKGDLGIAELKYLGGVKGGIQALRFSSPKPFELTKTGAAKVTINDKNAKEPDQVVDLQVLYLSARRTDVLSQTMFFKKTIKVGLSKLKSLKASGESGKDWTLTLGEDTEETFTLLENPMLDGVTVALQGFLGKTAAGYKLYPTHTVKEIVFERDKGKEEN